jgi:hypothetical protein
MGRPKPAIQIVFDSAAREDRESDMDYYLRGLITMIYLNRTMDRDLFPPESFSLNISMESRRYKDEQPASVDA